MRRRYILSVALLMPACDPSGTVDFDDSASPIRVSGDHDVSIDLSPPSGDNAADLGLVATASPDPFDQRVLPAEARPFPGVDTDGDGLYDAFERSQGLDPLNPDTDGDGIHDHWDLLGSERALVALDDDGFAWFDPSVTEELPLPANSRHWGEHPMYGIHLTPHRVVLLSLGYGFSDAPPLHVDCSRYSDARVQCLDAMGDPHNFWGIRMEMTLDMGATGRLARWSYMFVSDYGNDRSYDERLFQPQTAPTGGAPELHWGPDPDADGLDARLEFIQGTDPLLWDTDGDGLPDGAEVTADLNPRHPDSDLDGVDDTTECLAGTELLNDDRDRDLLSDADEAVLGTNSQWRDTDGDGLQDGLERLHGTDPLLFDSNHDGTPDGQWFDQTPLPMDLTEDPRLFTFIDSSDVWSRERAIVLYDTPRGPRGYKFGVSPGETSDEQQSERLVCIDVNHILVCQTYELGWWRQSRVDLRDMVRLARTPLGLQVLDNFRQSTSTYRQMACPVTALTPTDADDDGLTDIQEAELGSDPHCADTDRDGVPDHFETLIGTDPTLADTDADGLSDFVDGLPVRARLDPTNPDSDGDGLGDALDDSDEDGLSEQDEVALGTIRFLADTDRDGLSDGDEVALGLDPLVVDSDADGFADGVAAWAPSIGIPGPGITAVLVDPYTNVSTANPALVHIDSILHPQLFGYLLRVTADGLTAYPLTEDSRPWPCLAVGQDWLCAEDRFATTDIRVRFTSEGAKVLRRFVQPAIDLTSRHDGVDAQSFLSALSNDCPEAPPEGYNGSDPDGDGISRRQEHEAGTRSDCADTDGDGLPDGIELAEWDRHDPLEVDTNNDGFDDALDFIYTANNRP